MEVSIRKTIIYSGLTALAAMLSITMLTEDFRISAGAVCLAVLAYQARNARILPIAVLSGIWVVILRALSYLASGGSSQTTMQFYPEFFFYVMYGTLLWIYTSKMPNYRERYLLVIPVIGGIDYLSNFVELYVRMNVAVLQFMHQRSIILVALIRGAIVLVVLLVFRAYRHFVLEDEEKERYRRLLLMASRLGEEVYWMQKNAEIIEETMNTAYHLYETMPADSERTEDALEVARNIHEIKKEYNLIMKGISGAIGKENLADSMRMGKIMRLLEESVPEWEAIYGRRIMLIQTLPEEFRTREQFALLSILRNLYVNAIESLQDAKPDKTAEIRVCCQRKGEFVEIDVEDNGPGIDPEYAQMIFRPGFSTKINYETGEISRGLGLSLVQSLVCERMKGEIRAVNTGKGTRFEIKLPTEVILAPSHEPELERL